MGQVIPALAKKLSAHHGQGCMKLRLDISEHCRAAVLAACGCWGVLQVGACLAVRRERRVGARHGGLSLQVQLRLRLRGLLRLHMRLQAWSSLTQHVGFCRAWLLGSSCACAARCACRRVPCSLSCQNRSWKHKYVSNVRASIAPMYQNSGYRPLLSTLGVCKQC